MTIPSYKIVIYGVGGVGKSSLTYQLMKDYFIEGHDPTIEDAYQRQVKIDEESCILNVLDTAPQDEYNAWACQFARSGHGFVMMYSITSRDSFEQIASVREHILQVKDKDKVPVILVGNKCDLGVAERQVSTGEGQDLAKSFGCPFLEASAKTGLNAKECFYELVREIRKELGNEPVNVVKANKQFLRNCTIL